MVDGTASGQIPNIVIQPQIPPSTPLERPAQQTIYVPTPMALSYTNMATKSQN